MKKYHIGAVPNQLDPELISKFEGVEVATIGHFRHRGFVHHSITPVVEPGQDLGGNGCDGSHTGNGFDPPAPCSRHAAARRLLVCRSARG